MAYATVVIGLGFGDEGKGTTVDYLVRRYSSPLVVRFNGGAQAGHNVVTPDGRHHCFSQWGAGTFAGARTFLSRHMMINPIFALAEASDLEMVGIRNPLSLLTVEASAVVTTPFHVALNRIKEVVRDENGLGVHGSCGMGIGETMADKLAGCDDVIQAYMLQDYDALYGRLRRCQERKRSYAESLSASAYEAARDDLEILNDPTIVTDIVRQFKWFGSHVEIVNFAWLLRRFLPGSQHIVFEGAQGVLLDEDHGFPPHTTWSKCAFDNALDLLREGDTVKRLGVLRTYHTRHGAGPLPTENENYQKFVVHDDHNVPTPWQGTLRAGRFDLMLAKYALAACGACDGLVFTHTDKIKDFWACTGYEGLSPHAFIPSADPTWRTKILKAAKPRYARSSIEALSDALRTPIALTSSGPTARDKVSRATLR